MTARDDGKVGDSKGPSNKGGHRDTLPDGSRVRARCAASLCRGLVTVERQVVPNQKPSTRARQAGQGARVVQCSVFRSDHLNAYRISAFGSPG
jgi:hypothetical protein